MKRSLQFFSYLIIFLFFLISTNGLQLVYTDDINRGKNKRVISTKKPSDTTTINNNRYFTSTSGISNLSGNNDKDIYLEEKQVSPEFTKLDEECSSSTIQFESNKIQCFFTPYLNQIYNEFDVILSPCPSCLEQVKKGDGRIIHLTFQVKNTNQWVDSTWYEVNKPCELCKKTAVRKFSLKYLPELKITDWNFNKYN